MQYLGVCPRFVVFRDEEQENTSLQAFCSERKLSVPDEYRLAKPNMPASMQSIAKYDRPQPKPNAEAWDMCCEWVRRHFARFCMGSSVISLDQAVSECERGTSPGYPWNRVFHTKGALLDQHPEILVKFWEDLISISRKLEPIWTCSQKVELRAAIKLLENRIRTFTASPIEHSISLSRLCLDFNQRFYDSARKHWSFVGASKFCQGFHRLFQALNLHPNGMDLDCKDWDSCCFVMALMDQCSMRWEFLRHEDRTIDNQRALYRLYLDIVYSIIILENGDVIRKNTGNPSGSANTIVDNTMILFRMFAYIYIRLARENNVEVDYESFMRDVAAALNGDDNTSSVADSIKLWFNIPNIIRVAKELGFTVKSDTQEFRPVRDLTFLSQKWVFIRGLMLPSPDTTKVLCSLKWGSPDDDVRWHLLRASALRIDSWCNLECRKFIQSYIEYLWHEYDDDLNGVINDIKIGTIFSVWKTDDWIWGLYSGQESSELISSIFAAAKHISGLSSLDESLYSVQSACRLIGSS